MAHKSDLVFRNHFDYPFCQNLRKIPGWTSKASSATVVKGPSAFHYLALIGYALTMDTIIASSVI